MMGRKVVIGLLVLLATAASRATAANAAAQPWSTAQCAIAASGKDPYRPRIGTVVIGSLGQRLPLYRGHSPQAMANGTDPSLDCGPAWIPGTGMPGDGMPVDIAGHHRTHMHPFLNLDQVPPGDYITVITNYGKFTYQVTWAGVPSSDWPYDNHGKEKLVASTCLYPYVTGKRHFIVAKLVKVKWL